MKEELSDEVLSKISDIKLHCSQMAKIEVLSILHTACDMCVKITPYSATVIMYGDEVMCVDDENLSFRLMSEHVLYENTRQLEEKLSLLLGLIQRKELVRESLTNWFKRCRKNIDEVIRNN